MPHMIAEGDPFEHDPFAPPRTLIKNWRAADSLVHLTCDSLSISSPVSVANSDANLDLIVSEHVDTKRVATARRSSS